MLKDVCRRSAVVAALVPLAGVTIGLQPAAATTDEAVPTAKNVIVLISDGAGYNQFDIVSLYEAGQTLNQVHVDPATGAIEHVPGTPTQVYEHYPVQVGQSHYSANGRASYGTEDAWGDFGWVASGATDSAAAATALGTGIKTRNGILGFDAGGDQLLTLGEQALAVGKKVGLVTDVPFNHATPAGFIAHNASRNDYNGLATEMIDSGADVLIGGGHPHFTDNSSSRPANYTWISQADYERVSTGATDFTYVERGADFERIAAGEDVPEKLFGLARVAETFQYNRAGLGNDDVLPGTDPFNEDVPSLATAAEAALSVLEQGEDGFFLMVEAGAVDWAGHANQTTRVIEEQIAFNRAIESVDAWVETNSSWDETLVVVTADHETGYLAGDGAGETWTPMTGDAGELPNVSWHSGGHTNALVPVFAKGAGSELLEARADQWDVVRGAYLDNTDIGQTVFDLIGHARPTGDDTVALVADVPVTVAKGSLSLAVAAGGPVAFAGDDVQRAALPEVTVADTRSEVQARGQGWTVSGVARDFTAGNRSFGADNLRWDPKVKDGKVQPGSLSTLEAPATLADADRLGRVGNTVLGADLELEVPADAGSGRYGSEITLTLFAKD